MSRDQYPFQHLGKKLKTMREKFQESLAEVSGAVEIDVDALTRIELGKDRPTEDILLLLINHFNIKDDEATKLWELAGYTRPDEIDKSALSDDAEQKQILMVMPMDARIVYSDMAQVSANNFGVVMNFMQTAGPSGKPLAIARIGMSQEHAKSVLELIQKTLDQAAAHQSAPKALPAPKAKRSNKKPGKNQ